jgi:hypothetical protein
MSSPIDTIGIENAIDRNATLGFLKTLTKSFPNVPYSFGCTSKASPVLFLMTLTMMLFFPIHTYGQGIQITQCVPPTAQRSINLAFTINGASDKRAYVVLKTNVYAITGNEIKFKSAGEHVITINLVQGDNEITIVGFVNDVATPLTVSWAGLPAGCQLPSLKITCNNTKWCYQSLTASTVAAEFGEAAKKEVPEAPVAGANADQAVDAAAAANKDKPKTHISITKPTEEEGPVRYQDVGKVPMEIRVDQKPDKKDNIKSVAITVLNEEGPVEQKQNKVNLEYAKKTSDPAVIQPDVRIGKGSNKVTVFDPKDPAKETASVKIICEGENCGGETEDDSPANRFNSIYTRGILGFEQSGASASSSVQKPFLEFFWNPPVWTHESQNEPFRYIYPRMSLWGSVRLTSVPQQISTPLVTFAPTFLAPINESNINKLVQGFDFLFGGEFGFGRGFSKGDIGTAFLPTGTADTKQKYSAYLIAGFGASNPLSPRDTIDIFKAPTKQSELDKIQPGLKLPDGTQFIAFVGPDRDSFYRQWYAGVRLKTHYFQQRGLGEKLELINRPGGMFDISVGQNEAVSGGRLHGMVMRVDGFYPLPVSNKSILYLYGNAYINLRRHATVTDPLILARAPSDVTVPADNVFVITNQPSNRDVYRIGIGVNLIELFRGNFSKPPEKKP